MNSITNTPHSKSSTTQSHGTQVSQENITAQEGILSILDTRSPKNVLRLQRLIGNQATKRLIGGQIQRKNLEQAGLANGLENKGTRALVGDTREANVYADFYSNPFTDRTAALVAGAEANADVGNRVRQSGLGWTSGSTDRFNNDRINALDPFSYRVAIPYTQGNETKEVELLYQHALKYTGYVTRIKDTGNPNTQTSKSMYDLNNYQGGHYSNAHDMESGGKVSSLVNDNTLLDGQQNEKRREKNLDAYTKIAGEGARWQCVRNHASNIKNDSAFFIVNPNNPQRTISVSFQTLWLNWKAAFGGRYNITDETVKDAILNRSNSFSDGGRVEYWDLADMRQYVDYNLDTSTHHLKPKPQNTQNQTT